MERKFNISMINILKDIREDINNLPKWNQVKILDLKKYRSCKKGKLSLAFTAEPE